MKLWMSQKTEQHVNSCEIKGSVGRAHQGSRENLWTKFFFWSRFPSSVQLNDCLNYICNFLSGSLTFQVCQPTHQQFSVNGRPYLLRAINRPCILKVIKRMATHASASHNTEVPHLVIKKVHYTELYGCQILIRECCFIHLAQFPRCFITWRQENCWNWWLKPIYIKGGSSASHRKHLGDK